MWAGRSRRVPLELQIHAAATEQCCPGRPTRRHTKLEWTVRAPFTCLFICGGCLHRAESTTATFLKSSEGCKARTGLLRDGLQTGARTHSGCFVPEPQPPVLFCFPPKRRVECGGRGDGKEESERGWYRLARADRGLEAAGYPVPFDCCGRLRLPEPARGTEPLPPIPRV